MKMKPVLRGIGTLAIVALFAVYATTNGSVDMQGLMIAVVGVVALISPEIVDSLPFGPSK